MLSSQTSKIKRNIFSKKLALFVVLAAALIYSNICFAKTFTDKQKTTLKNSPYNLTEADIKNWENSNYTFDEAKKLLDNYITNSYIYNPANGAAVGSQVNTPGESWLTKSIMAVIIGVLAIILWFCKELVVVGAFVLDKMLDPVLYSLTNQPMINTGWVIVRDVCNLFFLLALIFIAICTIFNIPKFHAKRTLLMLIIMALLINFSKPIAVFIFDGSQLLMSYFLSALNSQPNGPSSAVANVSHIADIVYNNTKYFTNSADSSFTIAVEFLFSIVFLFMFAVALLVLGIFLVIRLVAIWLLIIVSPLAFFSAIIPDFSRISGQWWSALFKYSYFGPAIAFFLLLSTKLTITGFLAQSGQTETFKNTTAWTWLVGTILPYIVTLVFLYASLMMAQSFGLQFGNAVVSSANKFSRWMSGFYKGGGFWGWGARTTGVADAYRGVRKGMLQADYWRWLTKEGRQKISKERQEEVGAKVATGLGVKGAWWNNYYKRAKEENEGLNNSNVIAKAEAGDPRAALWAVVNGDGDNLKIFDSVMRVIQEHPDTRDDFRHLYRKAGQTQFAAQLQALNPKDKHKSEAETTVRRDYPALSGEAFNRQVQLELYKKYADSELQRLSRQDLAKLDFKDFADNKDHVADARVREKFKQALLERFATLSSVNASNFVDMISDAKGANQEFIRKNPGNFGALLAAAQEAARKTPGGGQTPSKPPDSWMNANWS